MDSHLLERTQATSRTPLRSFLCQSLYTRPSLLSTQRRSRYMRIQLYRHLLSILVVRMPSCIVERLLCSCNCILHELRHFPLFLPLVKACHCEHLMASTYVLPQPVTSMPAAICFLSMRYKTGHLALLLAECRASRSCRYKTAVTFYETGPRALCAYRQ